MTDTNRETALAFLMLASNGKAREAFEQYASPVLRHHNPYFDASAQMLADAMDENARENPDKSLDVKHVLADGELVAVHSYVRMKPGDLGIAVVHLFRFEKGRIIELWDIGQMVPEESPNTNGMF